MSKSEQFLTVGFPHDAPAIGGPGSFQSRLASELTRRGHRIVFPGDQVRPDVVLVVAGTKKLNWLWSSKRGGTAIVHRLDGINWKHNVIPTPAVDRLKAEARNYLIRIIRRSFADHIIYQSEFVQRWWQQEFGRAHCRETVIYNAVDLEMFVPVANKSRAEGGVLLFVEGHIPDDLVTVAMIEGVHNHLYKNRLIHKTLVCGAISDSLQRRLAMIPGIQVRADVPRTQMPQIFANSDVYVSLEVNPPCPNAVIEALASGVPVVGFDTGSLQELVPLDAGIIVPYKGNPWRLDMPDVHTLAIAAASVLTEKHPYGRHARATAQQRYDLRDLADTYLDLFHNLLNRGSDA